MITVKNQLEQEQLEDIQRSINDLNKKIDSDVFSKQEIIDRQANDIVRLNRLLDENNRAHQATKDNLNKCSKESEGARQLINKLLNDIERLQQDVEWYKRTYENRSFVGIIKQSIKSKTRKR